MSFKPILLISLSLLFSSASHAGLYKCDNGSGGLVFQDWPCEDLGESISKKYSAKAKKPAVSEKTDSSESKDKDDYANLERACKAHLPGSWKVTASRAQRDGPSVNLRKLKVDFRWDFDRNGDVRKHTYIGKIPFTYRCDGRFLFIKNETGRETRLTLLKVNAAEILYYGGHFTTLRRI